MFSKINHLLSTAIARYAILINSYDVNDFMTNS